MEKTFDFDHFESRLLSYAFCFFASQLADAMPPGGDSVFSYRDVFCLLRGHVKQAQIGLADPTWLYSRLKQHRLIDGNLGLISAAP